MSQLALQLIEIEKKEKTGYLELGNCGLTLDNPQLQEVWDALSELIYLETLILSNEWYDWERRKWVNSLNKDKENLLDKVPDITAKLVNLKKLTIAGHWIAEWEIKRIENLPPNLHSLDISYNKIRRIENLPKNLNTLYIRWNEIKHIGSLPINLQVFDISYNKIRRIKKLPDNLRSLDLSENKLDIIGNLPDSLHALYIRGNKIEDLKPLISFIKKGIRYNIDENPLEKPPMEIAKQGGKAILRYFENIEKHKPIPNDTLKLILIGNTTSGKTSLVKYLIHEEFNLAQNSTHGMQITSWQPEELEGININVWDFGGQEYYHATHRLFLSNNAVYILLWEEATNRTSTGEIEIYIEGLEGRQKREYDIFPYEYWLENIRYYAKDSEVFLVQNKSERKINMDEKTLQAYRLDSGKEFHICLKKADDYQQSGEGQKRWRTEYDTFKETLLETLRASVAKYDLVSYWVPIREAILAREENYLDLADFKEICQAAAGDEVEIAFDLLMIYLRDIASVILYYEADEVLNNTVFIKPNWLNQNIYNILNYKVLGDEGEFDDAHVARVVGASQASWFVALMKQFGLIFDLPDAEGCYVAPQYLLKSCSNEIALNLYLKSAKPQHAFTLHFPKFLPKSVMTRFLATYGSKTQNHLFWKYGICFFEEDTGVYATYMYEENKIRVEVQNGSKRVAGLVFQTLYEIIQNDEFEVILEGQPPMLWRDLRRDSGRLNPALMRAYEHLIDPPESEIENFTTMKKIFISYSHEDMAYKEKFETSFDVQRRMKKVEIWNDQQIKAGEKWQDKIMDNLESADIIVLLLSSDFLASNFVWDKEFPVIKRRYEAGEAKVVPILLRPCDWTALDYAENQIIPSENGKLIPISQWDDSDTAFQKVVDEIKQLL